MRQNSVVYIFTKGRPVNQKYLLRALRHFITAASQQTSHKFSSSLKRGLRATVRCVDHKPLLTLSSRSTQNHTPLSSGPWKDVGGGYLQTGHRPKHVIDPTAPPRVLITGASGQIGTELVPFLRQKYGKDNVIASDVKLPVHGREAAADGPFVFLDVCDYNSIARVCMEFQIDWIFHMAALLSAVGEKDPKLAIKINNLGVENTLEVARMNNLRIYIPSSIAAFGDSTPNVLTPQLTIQRPRTIYGITKVYSELLGEYYHEKYDVDFRSLRYPGIISSKAMPGGGTTDYAVEIYHEAIKCGYYKCFLGEDTKLPMMYMPDCIKSTMMLMEADKSKLHHRVYNITGVSFTPKEQAESIKKRMPEFSIEYVPDFRQQIAGSWPQTIDDSEAREHWGWQHDYGLEEMTEDMLAYLHTIYKGLP
eukprot:CAMPEP_0202690392 /NCGR_PEP_ID=MMETSP1385-20130828/5384_1 /ASSEMBLY_ACC=CAM_ASM_000861 /TAXON_ID=933848 /ORGANISM="Elphidium margaritaceum" /LENGTH=419 /DNA_ID=CAMNT_0049345653 /DNA_START=70 /DNA_END=1329 /DNA_ORIENTATION=-